MTTSSSPPRSGKRERLVSSAAELLHSQGVERTTLAQIAEAADVLYHLLVLLHARGISLAEVEAELDRRTRQSGLDEKAARKSG